MQWHVLTSNIHINLTRQNQLYKKTSFEKQVHAFVGIIFSFSILQWNVKITQREYIISVLLSSRVLYVPLYSKVALLIAKKGIVFLRSISMPLGKRFLSLGKWTVCPSNNNNIWFQEILSLCHLKSCNTATSHSWRPTQAYFPSAGFIKHLNISSIGSRRKDLAEFVGPKRKTLLLFFLPCQRQFLIALEKL